MYEIMHTTTKHVYKSGFDGREEAKLYLARNRDHLKKYLPADCSTGTFEVRPQI